MTNAYPHYYKDFRCIAERCRHNCCIGWEIDIDKITYKKYRRIKEIKSTVRRDLKGAHFKTDERGRCLQLTDGGRCRIIERFGEDYLCDICRLHPRFKNYFPDRCETGLGLSCEEAARLIIESETPFFIENDGDDNFCEFRKKAFLSPPESLLSLVSNEWTDRPNGFWQNLFISLERLDGEWDAYLSALTEPEKTVPPREHEFQNLLCYFIFRHLKGEDLKKELSFAYLSYYIIKELYKRSDGSGEALIEIARLYSAEIEYSNQNTRALFDLF